MGIKSFQGKMIGGTGVNPEKIEVRDFMIREVIYFHEQEHIFEVMQKMIQYNISGGPVVDDQHQLVGVISEGDCIKQLSESRYYNQPLEGVLVSDYMIKEVETVAPDMQLFDLAQKFLNLKLRRFPVCENQKLIGLVSQRNVLDTALALHGHTWQRPA
ncbi:CBS domain-containing protein [Mesonia sp. HuA40]|uniref:CBS domain-containing protein n=1 Tax=Mesonia sp. HuA40 TaxID=2602761 RepID=UPI0011C76358|nr:CBS domain-containing protein [Mesonia sp. HuA40]TXK73338.1 CBS domain-containing protein [Mesonia sp. HuA40]